ncbi:MAG: CaiB/BaiF CoA-transferase family protein [Pseudomonadota bacterium]
MKDALAGIRVIDLSVNAPGPFATRFLADLGAEVTVIENPRAARPDYAGAEGDPLMDKRGGPLDALALGKARLALDLKSPAGRTALLAMVAEADVLVSEMRPGKLEALGLGWEALSAANPRLILCRISGYGSRSPLAPRAGHDIGYIARAGALDLCRAPDGRPVPPQNILSDYAAGGTMGAAAILAALLRRDRTGQGADIDLSMTDGVRYLLSDIAATTLLSGLDVDDWRDTLGGGMPTYAVYETADRRWMAVGALEPKFIAVLAEALAWPDLSALMADRAGWAEARTGLATRFAAETQAHWTTLFDPLDACVAPVAQLEPGGPLPTLEDVFGPNA